MPPSDAQAQVVIRAIFCPPIFTDPLTSSVADGEAVQMPTFPLTAEIGAVLASSSKTEFTMRFHEAEESWLVAALRSAVVRPEESAAYESDTPRIPAAKAAQPAAFFRISRANDMG